MRIQLEAKRALLLGYATAFLMLSLSPAADFTTGKLAYGKGDYASAAREWREAAEHGDLDAQHWLSSLYMDGLGVPQDFRQALRWDWEAARGGQKSAQQTMGWPFTDSDMPYLTCTPLLLSKGLEQKAGNRRVVVSSMQSFNFQITLHNARPVLEYLLVAGVETTQEQPKQPNVEIEIRRIENEQRIPVARRLVIWGTSGGGPQTDDGWLTSLRGGGIQDESLRISLRVPVEASERKEYVDQFLAALAQDPAVPQDLLQNTRLLLNTPSVGPRTYIDEIMPNRLGVYEIACRYQSRKSDFWPGALVAPPLRFEFVKTMGP